MTRTTLHNTVSYSLLRIMIPELTATYNAPHLTASMARCSVRYDPPLNGVALEELKSDPAASPPTLPVTSRVGIGNPLSSHGRKFGA